jgi:hypothetical protein
MFDTIRAYFAPLLLLIFVTFSPGSGAIAQEAVWRVSKSSGEASVITAGQWLALTEGVTVKLGDNVRTGQNGQVLLKRGEETILMSPNSVIGIAAESKSGLSTTIIQQAGSILLEVEKRPVKHFAVETPSIAAVVKGTHFRVTVNSSDSRVDVLGGQVEVQDFKSGQYAMVLPKQTAMVSSQGPPGLLLSGLGKLNPIEQGTPRSASVSPMPPESHLSVSATNEQPFPTASGPITIPAASLVPPNSKQPDWSLRLASFVMSFAKSKATGPQNRREDLVFAGAVAGAIFLAVSSTVAMTQRRRKSKAKLAAFR